MPSPQTSSTQGLPGVGHDQPSSMAQVLEQPSPSSVLPSSQVSPGLTMPSPQTISKHGLPASTQSQPSSIWQVSEHPSPLRSEERRVGKESSCAEREWTAKESE